jgi:hypothetical protein
VTTTVAQASSLGASGPSIVRSRSPCPTITSARPGSRLAAPQHAHCAGRADPHDGDFVAQDLTPIAE